MMYRTIYESREAIPERVADLYDEQPDGQWCFALDIPGDEVPEPLIRQIEGRADARVAAAEAELRELEERLEHVRAETEEARTAVKRGKIVAAVRDVARAENVVSSAYEDVEAAALADGLELEGDRVLTRDGQSPREWLIDKRPNRAHWLGPRRAAPRRLFD